jgi:hypothetical protein
VWARRPASASCARTSLVALACAVALTASGCAPEDEQQRSARLTAEEWLAGNGVARGLDPEGEVQCTDGAGVWVTKMRTLEYLCTVRRAAGGCALLRLRVPERGGPVRVTVDEPFADCVQPF